MIKISEIFLSVQGEGSLTGTPSVFVRTSGCNLRCWYCDTPYASWKPEGEMFELDAILEKVKAFDCSHVVITGGEPMIQAELPELVLSLRQTGMHLTIETAGTLLSPSPWTCDLMSISPKLSNSTPDRAMAGSWHEKHQAVRHQPHVVRELMTWGLDYQLKFVVGSVLDAEEVLEYLKELEAFDPQRVMLMPRGVTSQELRLQREWLMPWCLDHGYRFCDREQIHWFGNRRGT